MVVFTCNNCGDSLQKPRVAKHYQFQCRKSISLTCVDCFKDFLGNEYVAHTKCITEAERYGSKDYVPKASANKGEKKQQEWIKLVNSVINGAKNLTKDETNILQYISKHENIPRKKVKFLNFVKSSMGYRVNVDAVESCWTKIEAASDEIAKNKKSNITTQGVEKNDEVIKSTDDKIQNGNDKHMNVKENEQSKKSSKKRKRDDESNVNEDDTVQSKIKLNEEISSNNNSSTNEQQDKTDNSKVKFDWQLCILRVLGTKDEMSLKKLEKKVVAKCLKHSNKLSNEKAINRFHKKLNKMSEIILNDNTVKRIQ